MVPSLTASVPSVHLERAAELVEQPWQRLGAVLLEQLGELAEHVKAFRVERVAGMEHAHVLQDFARARVRSLGRAHAPVHEHAPASNGASACAHGLVVTAADGDRASTSPGLPGLPAARRYSAS